MKVLLVFPPQSLDERYAHDVGNVGGFLPPLGLCTMAAVLERDGHEVRIMDCPASNYTINDILEEIEKFMPAVVGIATITALIDVTTGICRSIKEKSPDTTIILGGPHPTIMPDDVAKHTTADIVIAGEADNIISDVVNDLEKYRKLRVVHAGKVTNLDTLPFPARHLLDMSKYTALPNNYKITPHVFSIITSRGCPFTCTFCNDAMTGFRQRSVEKVIEEIKLLKKHYDVKEIAFWDDVLTLNKQWVYKFCEEVEKIGFKLIWSCYTRLDLIDESLARAMKKAGCWNIFFGIESGSDVLLNNITKKMTVRQMKEKVKMIQKIRIEIRGSFMLGLPGETPELARQTIKFATELNPDYAQFSITTPYPGTQIWQNVEKWGALDRNFRNYHGWMPVFVPYGYKSREELEAMQKEAFRRFYLRPQFVIKKIFKVRSLADLRRNIKGLRMIRGFAS
jgi:radical SAM superfamily enzyme YgiQ (UPF0313 family)